MFCWPVMGCFLFPSTPPKEVLRDFVIPPFGGLFFLRRKLLLWVLGGMTPSPLALLPHLTPPPPNPFLWTLTLNPIFFFLFVFFFSSRFFFFRYFFFPFACNFLPPINNHTLGWQVPFLFDSSPGVESWNNLRPQWDVDPLVFYLCWGLVSSVFSGSCLWPFSPPNEFLFFYKYPGIEQLGPPPHTPPPPSLLEQGLFFFFWFQVVHLNGWWVNPGWGFLHLFSTIRPYGSVTDNVWGLLPPKGWHFHFFPR